MSTIDIIFFGTLFLLTYSYLIYPLIGIVIGVGRNDKVSDELPAISVLVPACNEATVIGRKIENFKSLDYPDDRIEMLIADDGSTDETAAVVEKLTNPQIRLLASVGRQGKAATMNRLAQAAAHDMLLFTDANVIMSRQAVRRMVDHFGNTNVGAVTGEVRLVGSDQEFEAGESLYYWMERRIQGAESRCGSVMGVDGGMYLIRRKWFQPLPIDTILDDFLVSMNVMRSGKRVVYETSARATESGTPTARQEFDRRARVAAGAVQLFKRGSVPKLTQPGLWIQFISHKLLRWLSPILMVVLLVANVLLVHRGLFFQLLLVAQLAVYFSMFVIWLFPRLRKTPVGSVLFYFGLSQVAISVGLVRGLLNRQSVQWEKGIRRISQSESCQAGRAIRS